MTNGKYSWLKKNPIVLLLRRLYRLFFKPKQNFVRFNPEHHLAGTDQSNAELLPVLETQIEIEEYNNELVTIGQLLEQVNWQNAPITVPVKRSKTKRAAKSIPINQDQVGFDTVGELFQQVKWRVPPKVIQEQFLTTSKKPPAYDASLN
jgi:hypothetical protein